MLPLGWKGVRYAKKSDKSYKNIKNTFWSEHAMLRMGLVMSDGSSLTVRLHQHQTQIL